MKVKNTSLHRARMQAAIRMAGQRLGAPKQTHTPAFTFPQWIYRSDRAPSFSQLGDTGSSTQPC